MKWNEKGANHLWILELDRVKDEGMKESSRIKMKGDSSRSWNGRHKSKATNTSAVSLLRYWGLGQRF